MKKIIISITAILVTVIGIIFIFRNQIKENNIGECYFQETEKEHIALDNSGIKYANNEILVVAKDNINKKEIENLAKKYNAEIVGYIEQTGDYQWKINSSYTLKELKEIIINIEEENIIETAEINYISEISISDLSVQHGKEWSGEIWDEKEHLGKNWGLEAIHCISAWNLLEENKEKVNPIRLGLIDCGFDTNHEDLAYAETFLNSNTDIYEINHGTHVSGIMSAISNNENGICGVYPFGDKNNPLLYGYSFRIGRTYNPVSCMMEKCALAELILRNVKIINCSYGFTQTFLEIELYNNKELTNEIRNNAKCLAGFLNRLLDKGYDFVIVQASGNESNALYTKLKCDKQGNVEYDKNGNAIYSDNGNIFCISQQYKQYVYIDDNGKQHKITGIKKENVKNSEITESKYVNYLTAIDNAKEYSQVYDRIIVVGSVGMETDFSKALFDNTITINRGDSGYHISTFSNLGERVDVVAPGEDIFSTVYDEKDKQGNKLKYNYKQGTSMATPHVSGIAAIVWSANNDLTGAEVKDIICSTANNLVNLGEAGSDYNKTDYKLVNAKSAVEKALGIETIETTEESKNGGILNYVVEKDNEDVKIKNAQVVAVGKDGTEYKTTTDEQGHFELILPEGVYTLTITKDEYNPYIWENVEVKNEGVNYLPDWTKLEKIQNYTWHLEPTIEADNIIVPDYDNELYEKYAIIEKNGKYGLISNKGELIEDIKYNDFLICPLNIYVIGNGDVSDFELNNKENIGYKIENEKLIKTNHIGHGTGDITYYYYNINDNKVYKVAQIGDNCEEYKSDNVVLARCVSMNIKENGIFSCSDIFDEFYLVNGNGKINDTKYDDGNSYYSIQSHNIICAKKDDKWFYFNNKGDKIIFDNVKSSYMINRGHVESNRLNNNNIVNYPFLDVDNIIAVNTQNGSYFYDIEGNQLTNSNEFEEVRPMINGFAWVKKDGKWGVIKLKYDNQIEELNSWQTLYSQYLLNGEYKQLGTGFANGNTGEEYKLTDKDAKFQLAYIDNDDIPELIISGGYSIHIITVKDDELIQLKKDDNNGNFAWYGCLEYREREGFFLDDYQRMGVYKTPVYKIQDGECLLQDNIEYYESYESGEISHQSFIINNEEVSLDKYVNVLKKWRLNTYFTEQHSEYNIENDNWKDLNYTDGYEITESNIKIITNYGEKSDGKLITDIKSKSKNNQKNKGIVTIEDGYLNVRESPSTNGKIIGKLYNGDKITIEETSEDGKWYKISKDDIKGYVSKDYVKTN